MIGIDKSVTDIEIDLVLEALYVKYGYDYRQYSRPTIRRRLEDFVIKKDLTSIADIIHPLLTNTEFIQDLVEHLSIRVTEMFRDPFVYTLLREKVIPYLKTFTDVNVWIAGCATGEEAYSVAILLHEEGLLERTNIYATDISKIALDTARTGIYPLKNQQRNSKNYYESQGVNSFSDYYWTKYENSIMRKDIREHISFFKHNLVIDRSFNSMHLILCRNVMIYFNKELQKKVLSLLSESLVNNGFLCIGTKETLMHSYVQKQMVTIGEREQIYQKKIVLI